MDRPSFRINFYSGSRLDRATQLRKDPARLEAALAGAEHRVLPVWRSRNFVQSAGAETPEPGLAFVSGSEGRTLIEQAAITVLLGLERETVWLAVDLSQHDEPEKLVNLGDMGAFDDLRSVGPMMSREEGAILAYARGMTSWHRRHRFCGSCGAPTESAEGGHVRRCSNAACGIQHFPRTDPAVIMLIIDGDRCLLGRQPTWPAGRYSTLAGFVEPGESLEEAVAREVWEESRVEVKPGSVRYHSSQPWPFPSSLMLGFYGEAETAAIDYSHDDLEEVRWFERDWILANHGGGTFHLPRSDSIARQLVEGWLHGTAG